MEPFIRLRSQLQEALRLHLARGRKPRIPEAGRLVWGWFIELNQTRAVGDNGPAALTYAEIEAWARLHRWPIEARHMAMLSAMDKVYLDHLQRARQMAASGVKVLPPRSGQGLTAALFDAVF